MMCEQAAAPKTDWLLQSVLAMGALPTATPCARLHARNVLSDWGLRNQVDAVELVVSELVTNAVHASMDQDGRPRYADEGGLACVHVRLSSDGARTLVEVRDESRSLPTFTQASSDDEAGRGLMLVAALSHSWGWDASPQVSGGKIVWALVGAEIEPLR